MIKRPTFFMNAIDDPIIGEKAIDYEVFDKNENVLLGTTKYGGHLGYYESAFDNHAWFTKPMFTFLNAYK